MAAEKKPVKGILKTSSSFDHDGVQEAAAAASKKEREMKWDEMNILATYHPADKDYGHTKIDEPPTPYSTLSEGDLEASGDEGVSEGEKPADLDPENLASRLKETGKPRIRTISDDDGEEEDEVLTEEEHAVRKVFEQKRKLHYNEFQAVKLARQLMDKEDDVDDEDEEDDKKKEETSTSLTSNSESKK